MASLGDWIRGKVYSLLTFFYVLEFSTISITDYILEKMYLP